MRDRQKSRQAASTHAIESMMLIIGLKKKLKIRDEKNNKIRHSVVAVQHHFPTFCIILVRIPILHLYTTTPRVNSCFTISPHYIPSFTFLLFRGLQYCSMSNIFARYHHYCHQKLRIWIHFNLFSHTCSCVLHSHSYEKEQMR